MRVSTFWELMSHEFGAGYCRVLADDLVLSEVGSAPPRRPLRPGGPQVRVVRGVPRAGRPRVPVVGPGPAAQELTCTEHDSKVYSKGVTRAPQAARFLMGVGHPR